MRDFDYDTWQKKIIARGAAHKKNGSKSKKCTLPSDNLTPAQKRKLNGEVKSMNINKPMTWAEFKELPTNMAQLYLDTLLEKYEARPKNVAAMFGVSVGQFKAYCSDKALAYLAKNGSLKGAKRAAWEEFTGVFAPEPTEEPEETPEPAPKNDYWPIELTRMTVDATGDVFFLAEYIKALPLKGRYRMTVVLDKAEEDL